MTNRIHIAHISPRTSEAFEALDWTPVQLLTVLPQFRLPPPMPRTLCEWRVAFMNANYDCRSIVVSAYSKRHAKKLARKICRVKQWLKIERNLS